MNKKIDRRTFLKHTCIFLIGATGIFRMPLHANKNLYKAMWFEKIDENSVRCNLCPNRCVLKNGQRSKCRVREPKNGTLFSLVYNAPSIIFVETPEKFPLYHFKPQKKFFSFGTAGCNLYCKYCQNWQVALAYPEDIKIYNLPPEELINKAKNLNCEGIAYFYTEPVVSYEYTYETAIKAKEKKLLNLVTTAGYINSAPLKNIIKYIDAFAVTLKGFDDNFYQNIIGGKLKYVLETLSTIKKEERWLEIINLIVPTLNDDFVKIKKMCKWIFSNLGKDVPLHFSRFYPAFKLQNLPPTPQHILEEAQKIAFETGLNYVYINNLPGHIGNNTYCPNCKKTLVSRLGTKLIENNIIDGKCKFCKTKIPGRW